MDKLAVTRLAQELLLSVIALGLVACGQGGGDGSGAPRAREISGNVVYHSLNRLAAQSTGRMPDYSDLTIELLSQDRLLMNPAAAPLAGGALETTGCTGPNGSCTWSFAEVDTASVATTLVARIRDNRAASPVWIATTTNVVTAAELASGEPITRGTAFAFSVDAVRAVIAPLTGLTAEEIIARGFVFGLVYAPRSPSSISGQAVGGATVVPDSSALRILYPTGNFSGTAGATANQGVFLAIPSDAGSIREATFTVTPPAGQSLSWDSSLAAPVTPGSVSFLLLFAR